MLRLWTATFLKTLEHKRTSAMFVITSRLESRKRAHRVHRTFRNQKLRKFYSQSDPPFSLELGRFFSYLSLTHSLRRKARGLASFDSQRSVFLSLIHSLILPPYLSSNMAEETKLKHAQSSVLDVHTDPFSPREGRTLVWKNINMTLVSR